MEEKKMKSLRSISVLGVVLAISAIGANALVFDLNTVYTGATPTGTSPFATVSITDFAADEVAVTVTANGGWVASQFLSRLWLNVDPFTSVSLVSGSVTGAATVGSVSSSSNSENGGAGNKFDVSVLFEVSNNPGRLTGGETVGFRLTGSGLSAADFNSLTNNGIPVGAHIQGITGGLSSHVTVPEPGSIAAIVTGVIGLLGLRRRK